MDRAQRASENIDGATPSSFQHSATAATESHQTEENHSGLFQGVAVEGGGSIPHITNAVGVESQVPAHEEGMSRIVQVVQQPLNFIGTLAGSALRRVGRAVTLRSSSVVAPEPVAVPVTPLVEAENVQPNFEDTSELRSRLCYAIEHGEDARDSLRDTIDLFETRIGFNNDNLREARRHLAALNETLQRGWGFYNGTDTASRSFESVGASFRLNRELRTQINYALHLNRRLNEVLEENGQR